MKLRSIPFLCMALTICSIAYAQSPAAERSLDAKDLTLDEALSIAERTHPSLAAHRHRVGMAEGDLTQAGLWPNPELSISVDSYTPDADDQPGSSAPSRARPWRTSASGAVGSRSGSRRPSAKRVRVYAVEIFRKGADRDER